MIKSFAVILFLVSICSFSSPESFRDQQKKFQRVRTAYAEKEAGVKAMLQKNNIDADHFSILIRVFKKEREMEVWAHSSSTEPFHLIYTYDICASSGTEGPKRKEGDGQVPEGFYYVSRFNPTSNFYLSLGINYPNESDQILSDQKNPGGDIFIHGNCVTIGCIPMTDDKIKEIYVMAVESKTNDENKIPVYIFPCRMNAEGMNFLTLKASGNKSLLRFWQNLKEGYDQFENKKLVLVFTVNQSGDYVF